MVATSDTSTPNIKLKIEIISPTDLLDPSKKQTLRTLSRLVNDTFALHGHPKDNGETKPGALFTRKRLIYDEEFVDGFGNEGITAICTDEMLGDYDAATTTTTTTDGSPKSGAETGKYGNIVATASLKPFKGKIVDLERAAREAVNAQVNSTNTDVQVLNINDEQLTQAGQDLAKDTADQLSGYWNWEVKLCSSSDEPQYRGRGLMIRCVDALVAQLKIRQAALRQAGDPRGNLPIKLWSSSLEGTGNTEYWMRRGFVRAGEADIAPAGTWTSTRQISISTLSKVVE